MQHHPYYLLINPNAEWLLSACKCHPVELDFNEITKPIRVTERRAKEILIWAKALPGWQEDPPTMRASSHAEFLSGEIRMLYSTGKFTKEELARRYQIRLNSLRKLLLAA